MRSRRPSPRIPSGTLEPESWSFSVTRQPARSPRRSPSEPTTDKASWSSSKCSGRLIPAWCTIFASRSRTCCFPSCRSLAAWSELSRDCLPLAGSRSEAPTLACSAAGPRQQACAGSDPESCYVFHVMNAWEVRQPCPCRCDAEQPAGFPWPTVDRRIARRMRPACAAGHSTSMPRPTQAFESRHRWSYSSDQQRRFRKEGAGSMRRLQNDPRKICSFYQKPSLRYAAWINNPPISYGKATRCI